MRWVLLASLLAGCAPALPAPPEGTCTRDAKLPRPPGLNRSIPQLIRWANTAASVANQSIAERDECGASYDKLRAWANQVYPKGRPP